MGKLKQGRFAPGNLTVALEERPVFRGILGVFLRSLRRGGIKERFAGRVLLRSSRSGLAALRRIKEKGDPNDELR